MYNRRGNVSVGHGNLLGHVNLCKNGIGDVSSAELPGPPLQPETKPFRSITGHLVVVRFQERNSLLLLSVPAVKQSSTDFRTLHCSVEGGPTPFVEGGLEGGA